MTTISATLGACESLINIGSTVDAAAVFEKAHKCQFAGVVVVSFRDYPSERPLREHERHVSSSAGPKEELSMRKLGILSAGVAALVSLPSTAATFDFNLTGAHSASFSLPSSPTDIDPAGHAAGLDDPTIFAVTTTATVDGSTGPVVLHFYTADGGGGMDVIASIGGDTLRFSPAGDSVFGGTIDNPTFLAGEYDFTDWDVPDLSYHLSIMGSSTAVPEPLAWSMMIGGIGVAGGMMRHRGRVSTAALA